MPGNFPMSFALEIAATGASSEVYSPGQTSGGTNSVPAGGGDLSGVITHMRVINVSTSPVLVNAAIGATTGGIGGSTYWAWYAVSVPGTSTASPCCPNWVDWYGELFVGQGFSLFALAAASGALALNVEGYQFISY